MLLDPFEEQFHLPPCLVERADGGCRQCEVIGQEHQRLAGLGLLESDATQMIRIVRAAGGAGQRNGLIADEARAAIDRSRIDAMKLGVPTWRESRRRPVPDAAGTAARSRDSRDP